MKASEIQEAVEYTCFNAPNDVNGNPRRLFKLIWGGYPFQHGVVDCAYCGENWIHARNKAGLVTSGGRAHKVTATEYKKMMKAHTQYENA